METASITMTLDEQLLELEDIYADCLIAEENPKILTQLWNQIKLIRSQLLQPAVYPIPTNK